MTILAPLFTQNGTYSAQSVRQLLANLMTEGVIDAGSFAVTQRAAGANFSVDVAAGAAVIDGDDQANQGAYLGTSTATENRTVTAAPVSNSRYDIVVLRVNDPTAGGETGDTVTIEVIAGSASATPVAPAVPDSALLLATIGPITSATAAITTSIISDSRVQATVGPLLPDGHVTTDKIADAAVTTAKIADSGVSTNKLAASAVTAAKIGTGAVTETKIADDAVTSAKIAASAVGSAKIASSAVSTAKIADAAVTTVKIADGNVTTAKIADSNVTTGKIADSAITSAKIANATIVAGDLAASVLSEAWTTIGDTGSNWTGEGGYYKRLGNIVFFHFGGTLAASGITTIFNALPVGFRPPFTVYQGVSSLGEWYVTAAGLVALVNATTGGQIGTGIAINGFWVV